MEFIGATLSQPERLAAVELAIEEIAQRVEWRTPPTEPTVARLALLLPPTDVEVLEAKRLRVRARMFALLRRQ